MKSTLILEIEMTKCLILVASFFCSFLYRVLTLKRFWSISLHVIWVIHIHDIWCTLRWMTHMHRAAKLHQHLNQMVTQFVFLSCFCSSTKKKCKWVKLSCFHMYKSILFGCMPFSQSTALSSCQYSVKISAMTLKVKTFYTAGLCEVSVWKHGQFVTGIIRSRVCYVNSFRLNVQLQ